MAESSAKKGGIESTDMDSLISKTLERFQETSTSPVDIEYTDDENSEDEKYSGEEYEGDSTEYEEEDTRFLDVCMDGDIDDLVQLLEEMAQAGETLSIEMLNCPDGTGRTPVSYLCGNGMIEMLELVEDIPGIEYNTPDTEGMTPLHFAAQAGHVEVVTFLLNKVRTINVDPISTLGFTPLMKSAIQGRIKCSKLLLISGASCSRRDFGRGYTAPQWARYLGRDLCAESIEKFVRTAAVPGVSLADILADPRTVMKNVDKSSSSPSRSRRKTNKIKLKDMLKKKSSFIYNKVGGRKRILKDAPLAIDNTFGNDSIMEDNICSSSHSKSWLSKTLNKVLNNSTTTSKQDAFTCHESNVTNGHDANDIVLEDTLSSSEQVYINSQVNSVAHNSSNVECDNKCAKIKHQNNTLSGLLAKKKCATKSDPNPRCKDNVNTSKSKKGFSIPEIQISKVETIRFDEEDDEDEYDSS